MKFAFQGPFISFLIGLLWNAIKAASTEACILDFFLWKVLPHSAASGSLTLDGNLKWSLMWVLSSDSRKMSKYKRRKQRSSLLDLHSLLKSLALDSRKWVVVFILHSPPFSPSPVLRERPSACSPQPLSLLAGHFVSQVSCRHSSWQDRGCLLPERAVDGRGDGGTVCSLGLHEPWLPGMVRSTWYLVSGLLFWAGTLHNITVSTRNTCCEWAPLLPPRRHYSSSSGRTWDWHGEFS